MYEKPEVRFACRQYSNAFSSAKLVLGRREEPWKDPVPVDPKTDVEKRAAELLFSFAGGPEGQVEFLDRMGTYFVVPGDMALVGAYDPAHVADSKWAKWDVWSTTEVRWNGRAISIRENLQEDVWQKLPDYVKHLRVWNRHPRRGWESDSPVLSALTVLELIGLYDDRLAAECLSRIIGAGVWMIPQGMELPNVKGEPGTKQDFMTLLMEVAKIAVGDRKSAAANVPIMVEAAAEDIEAASKGHVNFWSPFDEHIMALQEHAIRRWASGVDLPAEVMLGMSEATHWNANLISEDRVQSFIIPSLRRAVGNMTLGWMRPALAQFKMADPTLCLWFDASGIKTRVDLADEVQWASDRFMVTDADSKYATGLGAMKDPTNEQLKRMMILRAAKEKPELVGWALQELGIEVKVPMPVAASKAPGAEAAPPAEKQNGDGRPGPQQKNGSPANGSPGRAATLSTRRNGG
jgi:hypothetical protein